MAQQPRLNDPRVAALQGEVQRLVKEKGAAQEQAAHAAWSHPHLSLPLLDHESLVSWTWWWGR
eukprot:1113567-Rhodomonas_salina.1